MSLKRVLALAALAPVFAVMTGCADSPDSTGVTEAVKSTANAQGGVCVNQTFPWINGDRSYGAATVRSYEAKSGNAVVEILSHRPSSRFSMFTSGDSAYESAVSIPGLKVKTEGCGGPVSAPR